MTRVTAAMVTLLAAAFLGGCGQTDNVTPNPSTTEPPRPTNMRQANPCSLFPDSLVKRYGLNPGLLHQGEAVRSCLWPAETISVAVYINWDPRALIYFSQAYPVPVGTPTLDGMEVIHQKGDAQPTCGVAFLPGEGTVIEVVSGTLAPASAAGACDRVKDVGAAVIRTLREQHLLGTG